MSTVAVAVVLLRVLRACVVGVPALRARVVADVPNLLVVVADVLTDVDVVVLVAVVVTAPVLIDVDVVTALVLTDVEEVTEDTLVGIVAPSVLARVTTTLSSAPAIVGCRRRHSSCKRHTIDHSAQAHKHTYVVR
jgi:hypothetical protein